MRKSIEGDSNLVIDYFNRFPLKTSKIENFKGWCKTIEIIRSKGSLTIKDLNEIIKLLNR